MQEWLAETDRSPYTDSESPVMTWIENGRGPIARGTAEVLSDGGAHVRLSEAATLAPGDEVAVRLSFSREAATVAAEGRVLKIRVNGQGPVCELEWTHSGPEREELESLIASRM
jgi:hypothetical protein